MSYLAIYLRLSVEDSENADESNSITNQRRLIYEYISQDEELKGYEPVEYCDDGYSGINMRRPAMQELLKDMNDNRVGIIIVKDMSRFSRDYIEMGEYLNKIFPMKSVGFIAINDYYDSRGHYGNTIEIDTAFRTLLYDLYSKDISMKVKTAIRSRCANGEYVFGQVPFGYEKSKKEKNKVIINKKEAEIVSLIFSLAMQGKSNGQIAGELFAKNIPTIMQLRRKEKAVADRAGRGERWTAGAVRRILSNRFYLGEMEYGKTIRKSVGSKNGISVPKKDRGVVKNHHEALITEEIFNRVAERTHGY